MQVLTFHYCVVQLRHHHWRDFIRSDNPVSAALLSSFGYNKKEKVQLKLEFVRMMTRLQLDPARMELLTVFFESYLKLTPQEEDQVAREIERLYGTGEGTAMEWMTSWEKRARQEKTKEIAVKMLEEGLEPALIAKITGLRPAELKRLRAEREHSEASAK